ncbi:tripartite tricarboxylate transporter TctB family protein [Georgenia thermotolerans]|uniref:Tripartite tricarboxylate transporter TctB family protein n=1 Tax=Georgenia thermotolerans TaxID=527326 RepID=A0A7J5UV23_9MICO|nr:tripartite tricarboxylate transporter TctB family protein [Georgenia thermotolerans]KAE8766128.1 tripartite tricarboxylate transporter TctB family protein [Georgenia thermotolerans]
MTSSAHPRQQGAPSGHVPDGAAPSGRHATGSDTTSGVVDAVEPAEADHAVLAAPSRRLEIVCAALAVVGSGALYLLARAIEVRTETGGIDPRWWPELLGTLGLALGVALLVVAVVRPPFSREDLEAATRQGWVRLVSAVALSAAFVVLWPLVGFLVATPVFLIAATYLFGGRGWKTLLLFPLITTAGINLLFHTLLKVPL